jgi:glycosyltransferase involved in cell wall biosynthesis
VRIVNVFTSNAVTGIPIIAAYLLRARPRVMLSQRIRVNALALRARALIHARTRMYVTANTNMTRELEALRPEKRARHLALMRRYFPRNDGIIAVSRGVADDLARLIDWPAERIRVAPNPVVTPELQVLARAPLDHPWFAPGAPPVVLGVGRLEPQKDFPTLLRAFARVRSRHPCRLMILGEGKRRDELQLLAGELGVAEDVQLPGFAKNPYAYMARAALFVLSSRWEGSPNSLTEALALGAPLVSTDCPDGPREILEGGLHGPLVPVGDIEALALAMTQTLSHPPDRAQLQAAAQRYTLERSATAYIEALGLSPESKHE